MRIQRDDAQEKIKELANGSDRDGDISTSNQKLKDEIDTLASKLDASSNSNSYLKELVISVRHAKDDLELKLTDDKNNLSAEANDLRGQVKSMVDDIVVLADESEKLRNRLEEIETTDIKRGNLVQFSEKTQIDSLNLKLSLAEKSIEELETRLGISDLDAKKEGEDIKSELETHLKKITFLREEITLFDSFKEENATQIAMMSESHSSELKNSQDRLSASKAECNSLKEKIQELIHDIDTQKETFINEKNSRKSEYDIQIKNFHDEVTEIQSQLNEKDGLVQELQSRINLIASLPSSESISKMMQEYETNQVLPSISELKGIFSTLESQKQILEQKLLDNTSISSKQITKFVGRIKEQRDEIELMNKKISALELSLKEHQFEQTSLELAVQSEDTSYLVTQIRELESQLGESSLQIQILQHDLQESQKLMQHTIASKQAEFLRLEKENSELESKIVSRSRDLEKEISLLKTQVDQMIPKTEFETIKSLLADKESIFSEMSSQMAKVKHQLSEEEEKKTKSIQLLRNSKNKILKLESELRALNEQLTVLRDKNELLQNMELNVKLSEASIEKLQIALADEQKITQLSKDRLNEMESTVAFLNHRIQELSSCTQVEFEELKRENTNFKLQLDDWPLRIKELYLTLEILENDLETSKRLFQTKSIETDHLKLRVSELEGKMYENSLDVSQQLSELNSSQREYQKLKRILENRDEELVTLRKQANEIKANAALRIDHYEVLKTQYDSLISEISNTRSNLADIESKGQKSAGQLSEANVSNYFNARLRL